MKKYETVRSGAGKELDEEHELIGRNSTTLAAHSAATSKSSSLQDISDETTNHVTSGRESSPREGGAYEEEHSLIHQHVRRLSESHDGQLTTSLSTTSQSHDLLVSTTSREVMSTTSHDVMSTTSQDIDDLITSLCESVGGRDKTDSATAERRQDLSQAPPLDYLSQQLFEELSLLSQSYTAAAAADQQPRLLELSVGEVETVGSDVLQGVKEDEWIVEQCITNVVKTTGIVSGPSNSVVKPAETRRHRVTDLPGAAADSGAADVQCCAADVQSGAADVQSGAADVECCAADVESGAADVQSGAADVECCAADVESEHRLIEKCVKSLSTTISPSVERRADKMKQLLDDKSPDNEHLLIEKFLSALSRPTSPSSEERKSEPSPDNQPQMVEPFLICQSNEVDQSQRGQMANVKPVMASQSETAVAHRTGQSAHRTGQSENEDLCEHSLIGKFLMNLSAPTSPIIERKVDRLESEQFKTFVETGRSVSSETSGESSLLISGSPVSAFIVEKKDDEISRTDVEHSLIVRHTKTLIEEKCQSKHFSRQSSTQSSDSGFDPIVEFYEAQRNLFIQLQQKNLELRRMITQMRLEQIIINNNNNQLPTDDKECKRLSNEKIIQNEQIITSDQCKREESESQNKTLSVQELEAEPKTDVELANSGLKGEGKTPEVKLEGTKEELSDGEKQELEKQDEEKRKNPERNVEERIRRMQELVVLRQHKEELNPKLEQLQQKRTHLTEQLEGLIAVLQQQQHPSQEEEGQLQQPEQLEQKKQLRNDLTNLQLHHEQQLQTLHQQNDTQQPVQSTALNDPDQQRRQQTVEQPSPISLLQTDLRVTQQSAAETQQQQSATETADEMTANQTHPPQKQLGLLKLAALIEPDQERIQQIMQQQRLEQQQQPAEVEQWLSEERRQVYNKTLLTSETTITTSVQHYTSESSFTRNTNIFHNIDSLAGDEVEWNTTQQVDYSQDTADQDISLMIE